jgi:preprotein translocase subunit SecD
VVDLKLRNFDVTETKDLANVLRAGKKLPADIVQSEVVGPSLDKKHLTMELHLYCRFVIISL